MQSESQQKFIDPASGRPLSLEVIEERGGQVLEGRLVDVDGHVTCPIRNGVPRFVGLDNYAENFGLQWNLFPNTQLDSHTGTSISSDRFWAATRWTPSMLDGRNVLDLGCGSGRFAEVALSAGAEVVAVDLSGAVDACFANLGDNPRLTVVQASVYELPFSAATFDFVYSLGVIQHTPDPVASIRALARMVRPGGRLCIDVYWRRWKSMIHPRFVLRPVTRRMEGATLLDKVRRSAPTLMKVNRTLRKVPAVGSALTRLVPVADYTGRLPLSKAQLEEWAVLDTFDWFGPSFDHPMTERALRDAFAESGLESIAISHTGHLAATALMPHSSH